MYKCRRIRGEEREIKNLLKLNIVAITLLLISLLVLVNFVNASENTVEITTFNPEIKVKKEYIVREQINEKIKLTKNRRNDYLAVVNFYYQYTDNWNVSEAILKESLEAGLPVNLVFALAKTESEFNPRAYNKNSNGTADRGLFQLNDSYRKQWTIEEFYDINRNTKEAVNYLLYCIDNTSSISDAFGAYNAGLSRVNNFPQSTEIYIKKILIYENKLNIDFNNTLMERL